MTEYISTPPSILGSVRTNIGLSFSIHYRVIWSQESGEPFWVGNGCRPLHWAVTRAIERLSLNTSPTEMRDGQE